MSKATLFRAGSALFIVLETFTMVGGYVSLPQWIVMTSFVFFTFALYPGAFMNDQTLSLICFYLVLCVFALAGHSLVTMKRAVLEVLPALSCLVLGNAYLYSRDYRGLRQTTALGLLLILVTSLLTIPILNADPVVLRTMVTLPAPEAAIPFYRKGIASIGLVHALPFIFPLLVYHVKHAATVRLRLFFLAAIAVPYCLVFQSSFATPLILSTTALLCSFLVSDSTRRNLLVLACLSVLLVTCVDKGAMITGLEAARQVFAGTPIEGKAIDLANSLKYGEAAGEVEGRSDLYRQSLSAFLDNPLLGTLDQTEVGGHSYFLDRLGYFGLIGTLPFLLFFAFAFRTTYRLCPPDRRVYLGLGLLMFAFLSFTKNLSGIEHFVYLLILVPGLCRWDADRLPSRPCLAR